MAGAVVLRALRTLRPHSLTAASGSFPTLVESVLSPAPRTLPTTWRYSSVRSLRLCCALWAGHNKWSKVKHIKGPKDEARSKMFMKFGMMIRMAVKEGGANPDTNVSLAQVLEQCRSKNMPKATIDAAIKGAEKAKPAFQQMFQARGPGGCMLLIEVLTDNNTRCLQELRHLIPKNGGMMAEKVSHNFNKRGVILVPGQNLSMDQALELAIEAGAEDVKESVDEEEQPLMQFICDLSELTKVRASLADLGMQVISTSLEFVPSTFATLDQTQLEAASSLIGALNDHSDVVRVWDNIEAQS
ncbi:translational activator of cytochrome c oxidase 1 isoform X2 [Halichoeres trimaculatus]